MSNPYVGEIRIWPCNFAPQGWLFCDGSLQPITGNETLFQLIGTTYGGDGQTTFALPDLRGRVPLHMGTGPGGAFTLGGTGGEETVTLTVNQIPSHSHVPMAQSAAGTQPGPGGNVWANAGGTNLYSTSPPNVNMSPAAVGSAGGSQPHDNMMPFLGLNFIISLFGVFPSQN